LSERADEIDCPGLVFGDAKPGSSGTADDSGGDVGAADNAASRRVDAWRAGLLGGSFGRHPALF
jgi:hypothetical protein